ncbi:uncharacterized protein K460DRAFT_358591 [Cucurbitaria berberidis CBS 394.84]|uniref:Uncharacterized protein n=1 Tax=Cucurbitaria berberidis CBS 394.84 TaxID=1168544 RepID=A0A9P4L522_9PLEO|nr:uncharacterized protein K460DRAFT_358591 [Cucurbitaria berberidis CBS 394.84]KAF1841897.1 hypothetical protein K460DRAFT_358591 [Cucurbitaria berberidis CBS 394.84]
MAYYNVPNWIRIILLLSSVLSFAPQLRRTISRKTSSGISTFYLLFNLISTTEQFALAFFFIVDNFEQPDVFVHRPINAGDWINLAQTTVVAILWLTLFCVCLYLPSDRRVGSVVFAIGAYIAFLLISVVPVFADAIVPGTHEDRKWPIAILSGIHYLFLSWIVTGLNAAAFYCQARETLSRPRDQALSHIGLAIQAVTFAFMAFSWISLGLPVNLV